MHTQMTALFATTPGISVVKDTIFPQRFMHCSELKRMGADIKVDNGTAVISGVETLSGAPVMASDLRASAALVLAALKAEGTTEIHRLYHIDRGYEMIDEKLLVSALQWKGCRMTTINAVLGPDFPSHRIFSLLSGLHMLFTEVL